MQIPTIQAEGQFIQQTIPQVKRSKSTFFISILDPDHPKPLKKDSENYKTFWIWDIDQDIASYQAFTFEQAQDMYRFMKANEGKHLVVHCGIGVSRSPAVAEFYYEMLGGSYKKLKEQYKNILPNSRILTYLRMVESTQGEDLKIRFV